MDIIKGIDLACKRERLLHKPCLHSINTRLGVLCRENVLYSECLFYRITCLLLGKASYVLLQLLQLLLYVSHADCVHLYN